MKPILFSLGSINFYSFGFFIALAFIASYLVIRYLYKIRKIPVKNLIDKAVVVLFSAIFVSHVFYFFLYPNQFTSMWEIFYFWKGGMISFGGLVGGLLAYVVIFKDKLMTRLDILAIAFLLGTFLWRIGCTMAGDHPTIETTSWVAIDGHVPVPLFESLLGLIGFLIIFKIYQKNLLTVGYTFWLVAGYYGLVRFIIDRWRVDQMIGNFTTGQLTGLVILVVSIIVLTAKILYDESRKE